MRRDAPSTVNRLAAFPLSAVLLSSGFQSVEGPATTATAGVPSTTHHSMLACSG